MRTKNIVIKRALGMRKELQAALNQIKAYEEINKTLLKACEETSDLLQVLNPKFDKVAYVAKHVWDRQKKDLRMAIQKAKEGTK